LLQHAPRSRRHSNRHAPHARLAIIKLITSYFEHWLHSRPWHHGPSARVRRAVAYSKSSRNCRPCASSSSSNAAATPQSNRPSKELSFEGR